MSELALDILTFISDFITEHQYAPTYDEMCSGVNIGSKSHLKYWIDKLADEGLLEYTPRVMRSIKLVRLPDGSETRTQLLSRLKPRKQRIIQARKPISDQRCIYCGTSNVPIDNDHFWPRSLGGHDANNLVPSCQKCNLRKSNKDPVEWVLKNFGPKTLSTVIRYLFTR